MHIKTNLKKAQQEKRGEDYVSVGEGGMIIVKEDPKRTREINHKEDEEAAEEETQARAFLNVKKKRKGTLICNLGNDNVHEVKESGASFSSKRAGGDVKLKDKP